MKRGIHDRRRRPLETGVKVAARRIAAAAAIARRFRCACGALLDANRRCRKCEP